MPFDGRTYEQQDAVLDLLRRARERIAQPDGWCQGQMEIGPAKCAVGWPFRLGKSHYAGAVRELSASLPGKWKILNTTGVDWWNLVARYNDAPGRTQADIVALYDKAIARLEQTGGTRG